ncbi:MAG: hypothetical protein AB7Q17_14855 [Phycisphaerae bacterium]
MTRMRRTIGIVRSSLVAAGRAAFAGALFASVAFASDASSSATVSGGFGRPGSAGATASYNGDAGFARTDTRSGNISTARGVAVGVDRDGLALSVSHAVTLPNGQAIGTNFNLSLDRDGDVSHSTGVALARGPIERSVTVGGSAGTNGAPARSIATARSDRFGETRVQTHAEQRRIRVVGGESRRTGPLVIEPRRAWRLR